MQSKLPNILPNLLIIKLVTTLLIFMLALPSCTNNDPVLIMVNEEKVTLNSFKDNYSQFLRHSLRKDNLKNRYLQANTLIDERLITHFAHSNSKDYDDIIEPKLKKIEKQLLLNGYYKTIIKNNIKLESDFLRRLFVWSKTRIQARHLFAKSEKDIQKIKLRLESGDQWEAIASEIFQDKQLRSNGGNLGMIEIGDMDPAFEIAAFSLKDGEISGPVQTENGYSIIQVLGREYDPIITEKDFQHELTFLKNHAISLLSYPALDKYTKKIISDLGFVFDDTILNQFWRKFQMLKEEAKMSDLDKILVSFGNNRNWDVKTCLTKMEDLSARQRNNIYTKERLKLTVKGLIVRTVLLEKSIQLKIHESENFKDEFNRAKTHLLIQTVLSNELPMKKNREQNRVEYFNFISDLKKHSTVNLDTALIKEFTMSLND